MPAIVPCFSPLTSFARKAQSTTLVRPSSLLSYANENTGNSGIEADDFNESHATSTEYGYEYEYTSNIPQSISTSSELPAWHEHQYNDLWPCGFHEEDWFQIWTSEEHFIDPFLVYGINLHKGNFTPWFHEYDFRGIRWRLMIDH